MEQDDAIWANVAQLLLLTVVQRFASEYEDSTGRTGAMHVAANRSTHMFVVARRRKRGVS